MSYEIIAMSHVDEAVARLVQVRDRLVAITERLLDIESRLIAAKAFDIERPAKISLREFSSNLIGETRCHLPTIIEKHGTAVRQSAVK
jgi:hypothetical protein